MSYLKPLLFMLAFAGCGSAACSQSANDAGSSPDAGAVVSAAPGPASDTSASDDDVTIDCAKVFTPADVEGLMTAPATVSQNTVRSGSCRFDNGHSSLIVYTGGSFTSEMTWNDVTGPDRAQYVALPGVGDEALRKADDGTAIYSRKGKIYCSVELPSDAGSYGRDYTKTRGEDLAKQLGALCNKVFAAS